MTRAAYGLVLAALLLTGCDTLGGSDPAEPATAAAPAAAAPTTAAEPPPSPSEPSPPESASPAPTTDRSPSAESTAAETAGSIALDIEQRHPNGSVLRVTGVTVADTSITVQVEVVNGMPTDIRLAYAGSTMRLDDDLGTTYEFIRPPDNEGLQIQGRGTLEGSLVFYGVPDPEATALTLQSNVSDSGPLEVINVDAESDTDPYPNFSVDIPLEP